MRGIFCGTKGKYVLRDGVKPALGFGTEECVLSQTTPRQGGQGKLVWNTINLLLTHNRVPFDVLRLSAAGIQTDSGDARTDTEIRGETNTFF